jgi:hypothetical protein
MSSNTPVPPKPAFRDLGDAEIDALLERNHVGRIAYTFHDRVDVVPVHYIYRDGWLYGRTSPSEKLITLRHHHWIAFEVDEVWGLFDWQSVVVHAAFFPLSPDDPHWAQAVDVIRTLIPDTFRHDDPAPHRTVVFRIPARERTGHAASPSAARHPASGRRQEL